MIKDNCIQGVKMIKPSQLQQARDFDDASEDLDFVFSHYFKARRWSLIPAEKGWRPATDVFEAENEIVIVMDIAGIMSKDISLRLDNNILTIRGVRHEKTGRSKRHFHKMEIDFGPFERKIEMPAPVDPDNTQANYSQGFLEIHLPKKEKKFLGKIEIKIL